MSRKKDAGRVSVVDIARAADVSVATVSRVLNQHPGVAAETKEKVVRAIKEMGYFSQKVKDLIDVSSNMTILVILPTLGYELYNSLLKGIYQASSLYGYTPVIAYTFKDPQLEYNWYQWAIDNAVAGVILVSSKCSKEEILYLSEKVPVIQCFDYVEDTGVSVVCINDEKAGYDATRYLIQCGYQRIAMISAVERNSSALNRECGYRKALQETGTEYDPDLLFRSTYTFDNNEPYVQAVLERRQSFDAVFCVGDFIAFKLLELCARMNIRVPDELAVMGFDNLDVHHMFHPALTTVSQNGFQIGFYATKLLHDQQNTPEISDDRVVAAIEHRIIQRETTRPPR